MSNSVWSAVTWDVARAGGWTAYILLALAVIVGLLLSTQIQSPKRWPRIINSELHNFLTLLSTIFLGVHILAVWIDPYTRFGWRDMFIPFVSTYRPFWMAMGIVSLYCGIAIGISTLLRPYIGYAWWRRLHVLTLGIYVIATIHGIGTGSDTQTWWAFALYAISGVTVFSLVIHRISLARHKKHVAAQKQVVAQKQRRWRRRIDDLHIRGLIPTKKQISAQKHAQMNFQSSSNVHTIK